MNYLQNAPVTSSATAGSDTTVNDMWIVAKGLMGAGEARDKYSQSWLKFGQKLQNLVDTQNPDYTESFSKVNTTLSTISNIHKTLAFAEMRSAEDFRDIIERYYVVARANRNYQSCKLGYKRAGDDLKASQAKIQLEQTKGTFEKNRFKLESAVEKAKTEKKNSLEKLKQSIRDLIEIRKKYDVFKVKRLTTGWTRYGAALKEACEKEEEAFAELQTTFDEMRSTGNGAVAKGAEEAIAEHMEENPEPEKVPVPENDEIPANPQFDGFE